MTARLSLPIEMLKIVTSPETQPFWDAAKEHRLVAPKCRACGTFRLPPAPFCYVCQTQDVDWIELSGRGIVYSYTVVRHTGIPALKDYIPYIPAVVELPDAPSPRGTRLVTQILGAAPEHVHIGLPVRLLWEDVPDSYPLPRFTPA